MQLEEQLGVAEHDVLTDETTEITVDQLDGEETQEEEEMEEGEEEEMEEGEEEETEDAEGGESEEESNEG